MKTEIRDQCMRLLSQAKLGDETAQRRLVDTVSSSYVGMVKQYYTVDPILDEHDILSEFYWGIWRAIEKVDHRGDPIFHLAQRGQWAVKSLITVVNKRRHGTADKEGGITVVSLDYGASYLEGGTWTEPADESLESDPYAVVEIREERAEAHERVLDILVRADLRPRHEEILQLLLDGDFDLNEHNSRTELAKRLGISGQRVTQLLGTLETRMAAVDRKA